MLTRPDGPFLRHPGPRVRRRRPSGRGRRRRAGCRARGDHPVVPVRLDERQVRHGAEQALGGRGLDRLAPPGPVDPLAHPLVPPPDALEDRVLDGPGQARPVPPPRAHPRAGGDPRGVEPVGHLGVAGPALESPEHLLIHGHGVRVLSDLRVGRGAGRLDVAIGQGLDDAPLLEPVAERPADPSRGVLVARLVLEAGEKGVEPPVVAVGVDGIVDGDQAGAGVLAELAEVDGAVAAADAAEVLDDDQVVGPGLDGRLGVGQVLPVERLAAAPAPDDLEAGRAGVVVADIASAKSGLVVEAALVLVGGADAGDDEDLEFAPAARDRVGSIPMGDQG